MGAKDFDQMLAAFEPPGTFGKLPLRTPILRLDWPRIVQTFAAAIVVFSFFPSAAFAISIDWDNEAGDTDWNTPQNWVGDQVPSYLVNTEPDATFVNPAAAIARITADIPVLRDIRFGDDNRRGTGTVNHSAGNATLNGWMRMGVGGATTSTYSLSGTGSLTLGSLRMSEALDSVSTFQQSGGTFRQSDTANPDTGDPPGSWNRIGDGARSTSNYNLSGGSQSFDSRVMFGSGSMGVVTVTQTGGSLETRRGQIVISDISPNTVYNISGGVLQTLDGRPITVGQWDNSIGELNISGTAAVITAEDLELGAGRSVAPSRGTVTQTGGTVTVGQNLTLGISSDTIDANISGTGIYNLQGGVLDLTTGSILRAGTAQSAFNMTGGRLTDAADIQLPLDQRGGVLAPSSLPGPGSTTITGDYTLAAAGTLELSLFSTAAFDYDIVNVNGVVSLAGNLDLIALPTLPVGTRFSIINNDGNLDPVIGAFAGKPDDSIFGEDGLFYRIDYQGGDGNDVTLSLVVPEPTTSACLLTALGALGLRRRRRLR